MNNAGKADAALRIELEELCYRYFRLCVLKTMGDPDTLAQDLGGLKCARGYLKMLVKQAGEELLWLLAQK